MRLLQELRRRNVHRVALAYLTAAWLLVQVAATVFPLFGLAPTASKLVVVSAAVGLIPVLVIAWVVELTPAGLKWTRDGDAPIAVRAHIDRKTDRAIMVALALALGMFALNTFVLEPQRDAEVADRHAAELKAVAAKFDIATATHEQLVAEMQRKATIVKQDSIAVLPFADLSPNGDQAYFSHGVATEILGLFSQIPELFVIAQQSSFSLAAKGLPISEIARQLNVAHILDGSVRKAGNQIRISVQLIRGSDNVQVWSESYDRTLDDIFAVQDDVAARVVEALKLELVGAVPQTRKTTAQAYELFLQATELGDKGNADNWTEAVELFQRVLRLDPDYVPAMTGMAIIYSSQVGRGFLSAEEGYGLARRWTERALELDPNYPSAYTRLAWVARNYERDLAKSASLYQRALLLEPDNAAVLGNAGTLAHALGRLDASIALKRQHTRQRPTSANAHYNLSITYNANAQYDEAAASARTTLALSPRFFGANYQLGRALLGKRNVGAALKAMQDEAFDGYRLVGTAVAQHAAGNGGASDEALQTLIAAHGKEAAYNVAYVYAYRGETDHAFDWLEKAVQNNDGGLSEIAAEPYFASLHADVRWQPFVTSLGLDRASLDAIPFDVALPAVPPRPFD